MALPKLITSGIIAERLGEPLHRVLYVLRTHKDIQPTATAGGVRLYDKRAMKAVEEKLTRQARQKPSKAETIIGCKL